VRQLEEKNFDIANRKLIRRGNSDATRNNLQSVYKLLRGKQKQSQGW